MTIKDVREMVSPKQLLRVREFDYTNDELITTTLFEGEEQLCPIVWDNRNISTISTNEFAPDTITIILWA